MPDGTDANRDEIDRVIATLADFELLKLKHFAAFRVRGLGRASCGRTWEDLLGEANLATLGGAANNGSGRLSRSFDVGSLVRMCREINSSHAHGNTLATVLLMRTVLNHVPPVFGHVTFEQVRANVGKSLKASFTHLEDGLRNAADFHCTPSYYSFRVLSLRGSGRAVPTSV